MQDDADMLSTYNFFDDTNYQNIYFGAEEEQFLNIEWDESNKNSELEINVDSDQFLKKFSLYEDNFFSKVPEDQENNLSETNKLTYLGDNLRYVKGTLTGFVISLFYENNRSFSEIEIMEKVNEELPKLRKNNGAKYTV